MSDANPNEGYLAYIRRYAIFVLILEGIVIGAAYWSTHQYPVGAGGFHLLIADTIQNNGFVVPTQIPYQIPGGVPFAYPPLAFYFIALLMELGVSGISILYYSPILLLVLQGIVTYKLSNHLLNNSIGALLTATVVVTSADILTWHINAGAAVRGFAFLFTLVGLYCAVKAFQSENELLTWWLLPAAMSFGIVTMSHPSTALFFVVSTVWAFIAFNFDLRGFVQGVMIGVGGFLFSAPWWLNTISTFGVDIYLSAGGTKTVGPSLKFIAATTMLLTPRSELPTVWYVFAFFGGIYLITERNFSTSQSRLVETSAC